MTPRTPTESDVRDTVLAFRVSEAEADRIRAAADRRGIGVTVYIRESMLAAAKRQKAA